MFFLFNFFITIFTGIFLLNIHILSNIFLLNKIGKIIKFIIKRKKVNNFFYLFYIIFFIFSFLFIKYILNISLFLSYEIILYSKYNIINYIINITFFIFKKFLFFLLNYLFYINLRIIIYFNKKKFNILKFSEYELLYSEFNDLKRLIINKKRKRTYIEIRNIIFYIINNTLNYISFMISKIEFVFYLLLFIKIFII